MDIKQIIALSGLSLTRFSIEYNIPYRTLQNWQAGENSKCARKCPDYVLELLEFKVKFDKFNGGLKNEDIKE